jgi:hypothetical protein
LRELRMAEKTIVEKAAVAVGVGIAAASDVAEAIKAAASEAVTAVGEVLRKAPVKKAVKKAATKKAPAKKSIKKAAAKKPAQKAPAKKAAKKAVVKKTPAKKTAKKAEPAKKSAKKSVKKPAKKTGRWRR